MLASVNDEQALELQVVENYPHRRCDGGRRCAFDLETPTASAPNHQQVEFGPRMRRPEETLVGSDVKQPGHLGDHKSLP